MTQIGKVCHDRCAIYKAVGDCVMPREGIFVRVLEGGRSAPAIRSRLPERGRTDDRKRRPFDQGRGDHPERPRIARRARPTRAARSSSASSPAWGDASSRPEVIPDEADILKDRLTAIADSGAANLILTTGGTGLTPRDVTPEATLAVADRIVPGFAEAMRAESLAKTPHAMLSRAVSVMRKSTLIINLPGSPRAVAECLAVIRPALPHAVAKAVR